MSNLTLNWDEQTVTEEKTISLEFPLKVYSLALAKDEQPLGHFTILPPDAINFLTNNHIKVFMQHGFAAHTEYSDLDYADAGAEFVDDFYTLSGMSRILVKFRPFTIRQVKSMRKQQVMFSTQLISQTDRDFIHEINSRKIAALAMNFIHNDRGEHIIERIISESSDDSEISRALCAFLLPLLMDIVLMPRLRFALQKTPALMQGVYCFGGQLCNSEMAELLRLPCRDIVSLCWGGN